jgi:hypothetical protein
MSAVSNITCAVISPASLHVISLVGSAGKGVHGWD